MRSPSQKTWKTNHKRFYCWHATHLGDNSKENDRETHVPIQAGSQQQRQEIATSTSNSFEKWPLLLFNWTHKGLWSLPYLNYGMCMCEMVRGKIKETGIVHREHVSTWDRKKNLFEKDPACAWLQTCLPASLWCVIIVQGLLCLTSDLKVVTWKKVNCS